MDSIQEVLASIRDFFLRLFAFLFATEPTPIASSSSSSTSSPSSTSSTSSTSRSTPSSAVKSTSVKSSAESQPNLRQRTMNADKVEKERKEKEEREERERKEKKERERKEKEAKEKEKEVKEKEKEKEKAAASEEKEKETELDPEVIDLATFEQILGCDDGEDRAFSYELVKTYFSQAEETIPKLQQALESRDLKLLSETGHFLKSSSAVLGVKKVRLSCEKIQYIAQLKDPENPSNKAPFTEEQALEELAGLVSNITGHYQEAKRELKKLYPRE